MRDSRTLTLSGMSRPDPPIRLTARLTEERPSPGWFGLIVRPADRDSADRFGARVREAESGRPLTRRQVIRLLREAGLSHGPGTVGKALADLTAVGELVNPRDKRGYRLPEWPRRPRTKSLF